MEKCHTRLTLIRNQLNSVKTSNKLIQFKSDKFQMHKNSNEIAYLKQNKTIWITVNKPPLEINRITDNLKDKTIFISGASRGIGLEIGLRAAKGGANVVILGKSDTEQKNLPGTIYSAAEEINKAGGKGLPIKCDIRDEQSVKEAVELAIKTFGGIDILVNNASAISLSPTEETSMKKYDLMTSVNSRGTFLCTKYCLPYLKLSKNPHILTISPPLTLEERWFKNHPAYSLAKYGMSLLSLGFSGEFKQYGIGVNCLWPRTTIATAAVKNLLGGDPLVKVSRKPEIMGEAAFVIFTSSSTNTTGNYFIDDEVLLSSGWKDLSEFSFVEGTKDSELGPDFFV